MRMPMSSAACDLAGHEHTGEQQGQDEERASGRGDRAVDAEADGRRADAGRGDEAGVDEADEGDEQADADRDGDLQLDRHGVEDEAAQAGRGEQDDDEAVDDHEAHRLRPGDLPDDADREERVDAQAGGERERQPGDERRRGSSYAGGQRGDGGDLREPRELPSTSGVPDRMIGFRMTM